MTTSKKVLIGVGVVAVLGIVVAVTVKLARRGVVEVQTGRVARLDLASTVTASGEIKPKTYANIGANAFGKITKIYVREGDHVKKGQLLAQIENVQPESDVQASRASLDASQKDYIAAVAAVNTNRADLDRAKADLEQKSLDYRRAQQLLKDALIPRSDFETRKAAYETSVAGLEQAKARVAQAQAQLESAKGHISQNRASLRRADDALSKTTYLAPFDGTVTNLPVREGETVVVGIQNSPGSTLMTVADMGVITAEVQVDETDIVNVKLDQPAEVSIDAIPKKKFRGVVTQIGDNAILRSTGVSTAQTTGSSQEAKDFKVVITLENPPANLRPGLSATAKITTATRQNVVTIPIQALTIRQRSELEKKSKDKSAVQAAAPTTPEEQAKAKEEIQGVFVIRNGKAQFVPVETGITGTTDIEVTKGLKEGDEIVTGSYKVLRTLRNGASVKINNSAPKPIEE
ncbi:MAG: efflux RND transporter periplasmic adaptor subunit [Terriglobia bacterium]|jgi:HlyD family secretion protein|nr:efflux RND transporter periplasmic adaptor subunit [Terriglobia bacterium]